MKKNLLTFMFVIAFLCGGALAVSAKTFSSSGNSVAVSKRLSVAKNTSIKNKGLKAKCMACQYELENLVTNNAVYEAACASGGYQNDCAPVARLLLLQSAEDYEECIYWDLYFNGKNIDKTKDRNKKQNADA